MFGIPWKLYIVIISFGLNVKSMNSDDEFTTKCNQLSDNQLHLITCFMTNINTIKLVMIYDQNLNNSILLFVYNNWAQQLYQHFTVPIIIEKYDLKYEPYAYDYSELFSWQGERFTLRPTQNSTTVKFNDMPKIQYSERFRQYLGIIVLCDNQNTLMKYIEGTARSPFQTPNSKYLIGTINDDIAGATNNNNTIVIELILNRLWKNYGLPRLVILSICQDLV